MSVLIIHVYLQIVTTKQKNEFNDQKHLLFV